MDISFITMNQGWQWGGSEELWFKTAIYAAQKGDMVNAHVYEGIKKHAKVAALRKDNVRVFFRPYYKSKMERAINKLPLAITKLWSSKQYWQKHLTIENHLVVISQSSSFDVVSSRNLCDFLLENNIAYVLVCQFNYEHFILSKENIILVRQLYKKAKKVFFVSLRNLLVAERQLACKVTNAEIVFNPVKVEGIEPLAFPDNLLFHMACVARLDCDFKGQDILLQMLSSGKWREREFVLKLYGMGPDEMYLENLIKFYGLEGKVFIMGHIENVKEIWKENSVLVLPSFGEGTPLSLIEAMACGRAAVVTDVGGNCDWVKNEYNGFIADYPDINALDRAMDKMWQNKSSLKELGKNSFEFYKNNFPENPVEHFYQRILNNA